MSAQSLSIFTLDVPNPEWQTAGPPPDAERINPNISFFFHESFDITTLSSDGANNNGNDVTGLLYVPDLDPTDPCVSESEPYIPRNVTRQANLPNVDYDLVAIAPWISSECSLAYMESARQDPATGFIFFIPGTSVNAPPDSNDQIWDIANGGNWKQQNGFPVYAIPSIYGVNILVWSGRYSGNMTDVPFGHDLTEMFDSRDYVRLYAQIGLGGGTTTLPSLWVFLLIVLGILLAIIGLTSLSMHLIQRRRRQSLRRRVATGEVDLEALGIKRLTVPQELLNKMPLYTYGTSQHKRHAGQQDSAAEEKSAATEAAASSNSAPEPAQTIVRSYSYNPTPLSQPTCAICLDDFVPAGTGTDGTTVRELPCQHIFHPECVDTFLRDSSSLCPMCKKTALPKGYCPKAITNAMVRRERVVRQIRDRVTVDAEPGEHENRTPTGLNGRLTRTMSSFSQFRRSGRMSGVPARNSQLMEQLEPASPRTTATTMTPAAAAASTSSSTGTPTRPQVQPPSTPSRREWARQRAVAMLGPRVPEDLEPEESPRVPAWRKAVRGLFPGR